MIDLQLYVGAYETIEPVQGFVGNETFRVRTAEETYYYKSGPGLVAEARACTLAAEAGIPAPEVVAVGTHETGEYLIQRAADGAPTDPSDTTALASAGKALLKLHQVQGDAFGRLSGPLRTTWADHLLQEVKSLHHLVTAGLLPQSHHHQLINLVHAEASALEPEHPALLHGDLHPRHLYSTTGTLTAIIDWGDALYGDPLYDLARFSIAGPTSALLTAYGLTLTPDLHRTFALYRALWSALACQAELQAHGDWFQPHLDRIAADLTYLS
ncbi:aminoglycoside phosphotransferase family protein [Kribbella lupini]|uniref:Aminoglycoside phosphotransferase domain-containing protein n=1 Tax=Kribbella lupini TaxID=291602 RepID=A0ABP4LAL9_9ACTN